MTINIHNDSEQQRSLLDETVRIPPLSLEQSNTFDQFTANLRATANKMSREVVRNVRSHRLSVSIVAAIVFLWALWYFFL